MSQHDPELCTCHREAVEELHSTDPELLDCLAGRPDSGHPLTDRP
jgi:hypothetical protein